MKIGINLTFLYEITGIGVYVKNLLEHLLNFAPSDYEFFIFIAKDTPRDVIFESKNVNYIKLPHKASNKFIRMIVEQLFLPILVKKYKIDFLFSPAIFHPIILGEKNVLTLHDLIFKLDKNINLVNLYYKILLKNIPRCKYIFTVSNFSKGEIEEYYRSCKKKLNIHVIYEGIPKLPTIKEEELNNFLNKFNVSKNNYFFYIGLIVPHKNISNMLKAFKLFLNRNPQFKLVLSGKIKKNLLDPFKIVNELNLENNVIITGMISDEEKVALLKGSVGLIFISTHEGFGLPVLEAQSLGVPVLTSNVTALPEISGKGALFVNPYNVEEITEGMEKIAFDEKLREDLIKKGYENIKRFSWEKAAEEVLNIFKSINKKYE